MKKNPLRIKEAIMFFNNNKSEEEEKLNQSKIGVMLLPEMDEKSAGWYVSQWTNDKQLGKLNHHIIKRICEITGVDLNFLFRIENN